MQTKSFSLVLLAAALGGCASSRPPELPRPTLTGPRIAINRRPHSPPAPLTTTLAARPAPSWIVSKTDGNVAKMLARWGKEAGWIVDWNDAPEILITGEGRVEKPDFLSAADVVISDVKAKGYAIKAKAYVDKVLEIKKVDSK